MSEKKQSPEETEIIGKQQERKLKNLPSLVLVYRANDTYEKYMPYIVRQLEAMGRTVRVRDFPKETNAKDIERWGETQSSFFRDSVVLTDRTSNYVIPRHTKPIDRKSSYLDDLFDNVARRIMVGPDYEKKLYEQGHKIDFVENIVKKVFSQIKEGPNKVVVVHDRILDHQFGEILDELTIKTIGESDAKWYKDNQYEDLTQDDERRRNDINERILALTDIASKKAASKIRTWLIDVGIGEEKISVGTVTGTENSVDDYDQASNWVIVDRHTGIGRRRLKNPFIFNLPVSDLIQSAQQQGLLTIDDKEFEQVIREMLEKDFSG